MTALAGWVGVDRKPSSVYLASDSRITFPTGGIWDHGRKVFASSRYPEVLGYCGTALFPSQALARVTDLIDADVLFAPFDGPGEKVNKVRQCLKREFDQYSPADREDFTVVYCTREGEYMTSTFHIAQLACTRSCWTSKWFSMPEKSDLIINLGSGADCLSKWYGYWSRTAHKGTSRSVFSAFCDCLASGAVSTVGGPPQLVGLYRKGPAKTFGVVYKGERYVLGSRMEASDQLSNVTWYNGAFEICDGATMELMPAAQRHPRPNGLGHG